MKSSSYISQNERKLLLIVSFASIIFVLSAITYDFVKVFTVYKSQFSGQTPNTFPLFHLFTVLIFASLIKTKRFLLPLLLTSIYAAMIPYGLFLRYNGRRLGGEEFSPQVDFHDKVLSAANELDYIAAAFISILLFWQISILFRMLIKKLNGKKILP